MNIVGWVCALAIASITGASYIKSVAATTQSIGILRLETRAEGQVDSMLRHLRSRLPTRILPQCLSPHAEIIKNALKSSRFDPKPASNLGELVEKESGHPPGPPLDRRETYSQRYRDAAKNCTALETLSKFEGGHLAFCLSFQDAAGFESMFAEVHLQLRDAISQQRIDCAQLARRTVGIAEIQATLHWRGTGYVASRRAKSFVPVDL